MYEFKRDNFRKNRGDYSRLLNVSCRKCETLLLTYQKDGPGNLRRLYFDRIFSPKELTGLQNKTFTQIKILNCKKCKEVIGTPYIYEKEKRPALRLYQDSVIKKVRKIKL